MHSSIDGHLGCSHVLAAVNNAAVIVGWGWGADIFLSECLNFILLNDREHRCHPPEEPNVRHVAPERWRLDRGSDSQLDALLSLGQSIASVYA